MRKTITFTFVLLFISLSCLQAQKSYIAKGDSVWVGIKLGFPIGNKQYKEVIQEVQKNTYKTHTPDEIDEFYTEGKIFVSMQSPIAGEKKVFFHQLVKRDSIAVYQYENETGSFLFFQQGEELKEITPQNNPYAEYVAQEYGSDSSNPVNNYLIKPTQSSIKFAEKLIRTRNHNLLVRMRYGIWIAMGQSNISQEISPSDNTDNHLLAGIFLNVPIHTYYSVHTELSYMREAYSSSYNSIYGLHDELTDQIYNRNSLFMPIMLRYSLNQLKGNLIPYFQLGPSAHFALKKEMESRVFTIIDKNISIDKQPIIRKNNYFYPGLNAGAGLEYKLNSHHSLLLDFRYIRILDDENMNLFYTTLSFSF